MFGLSRSEAGNLVVSFNNNSWRQEIKGASLETDKWTVVACSVDIPRRKVLIRLNARKVDEIELPRGFVLWTADSTLKDSDKIWSFSNLGNGNVFHGLVDEFLIYESALNAEALAEVPLRQ